MIGGVPSTPPPWHEAGLQASDGMDVLVLEGTTRFSPNIRGDSPVSGWTRAAEKRLGHEWTTLRNSFASLCDSFYAVTTSATIPHASRIGLCPPSQVRFLFQATPDTIGVLTPRVMESRLIPMPNMELERPDLIYNMRRNERVTYMDVSRAGPHPAVGKVSALLPEFAPIPKTRFYARGATAGQVHILLPPVVRRLTRVPKGPRVAAPPRVCRRLLSHRRHRARACHQGPRNGVQGLLA